MRRLCLLLVPALALAIYDMKWFDANRWRCPFYNDGRWGIDVTQGAGAAGGSWPQPLRNFYVFGAGPWVGAVAGGDTFVSVGYNPNSGGTEFGPTLCRYWRQGTGDSLDRIYKYPGDWPPPPGRFPMAPQQSRSELDLWCCFGDSDPANHIAEWLASGVVVAGGYAYLATGGAGLSIVDVSSPQNPYEVGHCYIAGGADGVAVAGDYAYVTAGNYGLRVVSIADPDNPYEVGCCSTMTLAWDVAVAGDYAYVADYTSGLRVINVSDPESPYQVGYCNTPGLAWDVAVAGSCALVADNTSGLRVIDVSNPQSPSELGYYDTPGHAYGVAVAGSYAYVADGDSGLRVIDVSDPQSPHEVGSCGTPGYACGVTVAGAYAYVADGNSGLRIIDVSSPPEPREVGCCGTPGSANDVTVAGGYAYVADGTAGLRVINITNPRSPREVGYFNPHGMPRGVDVCLTVYGYSDSLARDVFLLKYELTNCSGSELSRTYFALALDGDVGDATDDMTGLMLDKLFRVGPDTFRVKNTGYVYDYNNVENRSQYWESGTPGAVAVRLLHAPHGLGLTSCKRFTIDIDPVTDRDQYLTMAGYNYRTGMYEPFDSVDAMPADKRVLLSTGPFDLAADSTVTFYYAVIAAPYGEAGQPPGNRDTTELGLRCWWAEQVLERVLAVEERQPRAAQQGQVAVGPTVFNRAIGLRLSLPMEEEATVSIHDATGRVVRTRMSVPRGPDGTARLDFGAFAPGVYLVRVQTANLSRTFKVLNMGE